MVELRSFMDRKVILERRGSRRVRCVACLDTQRLSRTVRRLPVRATAVFLCFEAGSMKYLGMVDEFLLVQTYLQKPGETMKACLGGLPKDTELHNLSRCEGKRH